MTPFNYEFAKSNGFYRHEFLFRPKSLSLQDESLLVEEYLKNITKNLPYKFTHPFLSVAYIPFPDGVRWLISLKQFEKDKHGFALFQKKGVVLNVEELFIELERSIREITQNEIQLVAKGIFLGG